MPNPEMRRSGAEIDETGTFRYRLWREWKDGPVLIFCLLNPSTAGELVNDPTVCRCITRADRMGFGGIEVVNLFALRSTDPAKLRQVADPVGPKNDEAILAAARGAGRAFICGWGANAGKVDPGRARRVLTMLAAEKIKPLALRLNDDGSPQHPLYLPYNLDPVLMPV